MQKLGKSGTFITKKADAIDMNNPECFEIDSDYWFCKLHGLMYGCIGYQIQNSCHSKKKWIQGENAKTIISRLHSDRVGAKKYGQVPNTYCNIVNTHVDI